MNTATYSQLANNNNKILVSNPCGHMNWDVSGSIQGVWLNAQVDAQTPDPSNTATWTQALFLLCVTRPIQPTAP